MPSVQQLRPFAYAPVQAFLQASGPVVLIQQPPEPVFQQVALRLAEARTVGMAHRSRLVDRLLVMLQAFDSLEVHFLGPEQDGQELRVGRMEGCTLMVHDPSVSKQHAVLRWHATQGTCSVKDLASMNGTWLNAAELGEGEERMLTDGDALAFGDAQFLYLRAETLHSHLRLASPGGGM
ncbi:FHA domain-containing protein [Corallococcus exiguus]|uniref:FHA domain-containing protein n=1 Tax=Corallococcus TaxID=83461 RepID=UPI000EA13556|nr:MULTISPECIES: FHA domain-containing protein [Corallococcus]MBN8465121.1 FHA domain-containing protein [Corallococcus exiguus]RKH30791.1 FHA domain-containing protein [Corallococcus sp. CA041A]